MNIKLIFFILCCSIVFTACKKEYSVEDVQQPKPVPQPVSNTEVITVGEVSNVGGAVYWRDSVFSYVEPSATTPTLATAVEKWNGNLIILGSYELNNFFQTCYWINGQRYALPVQPSECYITDAKVYNSSLYILAYAIYRDSSILFKLNNIGGTAQSIALTLPNNAKIRNQLYVSNMAVANNKLLIFGDYSTTANNRKPCIWEVDAADNVTSITPENNINNINFNTAWGDAKGTQTYLIGDSVDSLYIWTKNGRFISLDKNGFISNIFDSRVAKIDDKGDLYFLYTNASVSRVQLHKITASKQVTSSIFPAPNNHRETSFGMDILGDEYVYGISGRDITNNSKYAFIQKNNINIPLKMPNNVSDFIFERVRIFQK